MEAALAQLGRMHRYRRDECGDAPREPLRRIGDQCGERCARSRIEPRETLPRVLERMYPTRDVAGKRRFGSDLRQRQTFVRTATAERRRANDRELAERTTARGDPWNRRGAARAERVAAIDGTAAGSTRVCPTMSGLAKVTRMKA